MLKEQNCLDARLERLACALERMRLDEYLEFAANPRRVLLSHALFGAIRGMGFALGFSVFSAVAVVALRHIVADNIPLIGGFLAEVINAIQQRL